MAFSEFELKRYDKVLRAFVERRQPPAHQRDQLDFGYRIEGQSVEIFEIRPVWRHPEEKMTCPIAKATWVKSRKAWKIFWQRADLKWHTYEPDPQVRSLETFLDIVQRDDHACFFG
jgi:hypothetical protein